MYVRIDYWNNTVKNEKTKTISFSSILGELQGPQLVPHSFQWEILTALMTETPLNPYGIGLMSLSLIWKQWELRSSPSQRKKCSKICSLMTSHDISPSSPRTSMAGAASGECSEKKKLRPCHMEETALPAAESRFGGKTWGFQREQKGGPPSQKKKHLLYSVYMWCY